jgi:hypothetical protein
MIGLAIGLTRFFMELIDPETPVVKEVHFLQ